MGGSVTFLAAARRALGAAVTFYGGGVAEGRFGMPPLVELAPGLKTPWLGLFGDEDQGIPVDQVEALRTGGGHGAGGRPRSSATPAPVTAFTATPDPTRTTNASAHDAWQRTLTGSGAT